ncbi:MAG: hypothetical protein Q9180_002999 [Flavoplaca navasiana]
MTPTPPWVHVVEKVTELFTKAVVLFDSPFHLPDIAYDGEPPLPVTPYLPADPCCLPDRIPILTSNGVVNVLQDGLYYMHPSLGPNLGYAVLAFEGPSQSITPRKHNRKIYPDREVVVKRVIDGLESFAASYSDLKLDLDRIAIAGVSPGGYFALRGWLSNHVADSMIGFMMEFSYETRWGIRLSGTFYGLVLPAEIMLQMKKYDLAATHDRSLLHRVKCPVLVTGAVSSLYVNADHHSMRAYNALNGLKESQGDDQIWMSSSLGQARCRLG